MNPTNAREVQVADEKKINEVATEISKILQKNGLGMQAVIQIFKLPTESPIIAQESTDTGIINPETMSDNDKAFLDMLKPVGDEISPRRRKR